MEFLEIRISSVYKPPRGSMHTPIRRVLAVYRFEQITKLGLIIDDLNEFSASDSQIDKEALLDKWPQFRGPIK